MEGHVTETEPQVDAKKRTVKLTEKALLGKFESLQKDRKGNLQKAHGLKETILGLMVNKSCVEQVKGTFEQFNVFCGEAKVKHETLMRLLPKEEGEKHETWYNLKMLSIKLFSQDVNKWLLDNESCPSAKGDVHNDGVNVEPQDSISNVQSNASSKRSSRTSNVSKGSRSTTSATRLQAEAEKAALMARAAALHKKHALEEQEEQLREQGEQLIREQEEQRREQEEQRREQEEQRRRQEEQRRRGLRRQEEQLRKEKERLELDTEVAASTAKLAVLNASNHDNVSKAHSDGMESYFRKGTALNLHAEQYIPQQKQSFQHQYSWSANAQPTMVKPIEVDEHETTKAGTQTKYKWQTSDQIKSRHSDVKPSGHQATSSRVNPEIPGELYSLLERQNEVTALLVQTQNSQSLPHREIPTFTGDPLHFRSFIRAFEHCVEAKTSRGDCLYYLEQFTRGQPRDLVRSCQHMDPERGYSVAKDLLQTHFGNESKVTAAYVDKIIGWPAVKAEDGKGLQAYALCLRECCNAMEELQYLDELNMPANMKMMTQKLPYKLREKWRAAACDISESQGRRSGFKDIIKFIEYQVKVISDPIFGDIQDTQGGVTKGEKAKLQQKAQLQKRSSFATAVFMATEPAKSTSIQTQTESMSPTGLSVCCLYCTRGHALEHCPQLRKRTHQEKLGFLKEKWVCFGCLRTGHISKSCNKPLSCEICNQNHPSTLHINKRERSKGDDKPKELSVSGTTVSTCGHTGAGGSNGILSILPVNVKCTQGNNIMQTYAFLDPGSTDTFCSERLMEKLNIKGRKTKIHLRTISHNITVPSCIVEGVEISELANNHFFELPKLFMQKKMPVSTDNIISEEELSKWTYLKGVDIPRINADVDLLIGTNASKLMEPRQVINSRGKGPYAVRTLLGWVINGPLHGNGAKQCEIGYPAVTVNKIAVDQAKRLQGAMDQQFQPKKLAEQLTCQGSVAVERMKMKPKSEPGFVKRKKFAKGQASLPEKHFTVDDGSLVEVKKEKSKIVTESSNGSSVKNGTDKEVKKKKQLETAQFDPGKEVEEKRMLPSLSRERKQFTTANPSGEGRRLLEVSVETQKGIG